MIAAGTRKYGWTLLLLLCFTLTVIVSGRAGAQDAFSGGIIEEIRVEGMERVDPETVRSYMALELGEEFDPLRLDQALRNLFNTGLFADVTLRRDGNALVVSIVENPMINRIAFEGNRRINNDDLRAEIQLRPRVVYTRTRVQQDVQRILEVYRRRGRFAATVEPKLIELDQNRIDLVFEIDEGPVTRIHSINFVGNEAYSDSRLRGEIATRESAWYRFLSTSDTYDPDRLAFDRELLRRFYLSEGYADFRVVSAVAELTMDRSGFIITFTIDEGERYRFGEVDLVSQIRNLEIEDVEGVVSTREGDWYDASRIEDTIDDLSETVVELGFPFVQVTPRTQRDRDERLIHLTYEIAEGPRLYVERIDIEGNLRTIDKVIRREFRLVEGDAFNAARLNRSRQRLERLGFFRSVEVDTEPGSEPDRTIVKTRVEEQATGDITFGAGFSTAVGFVGSVQLRERNLLGRGQDLRLGFTLSGRSSEIDLSFTEPYFLDRPMSAGFDLFRTTTEQREIGFDQERLGFALRVGYDLTEHIRQVVRYQLERRTIKNVSSNAPLDVRQERGRAMRSSIAQITTLDRRDAIFAPTEGYIVELYTELTGLGGNVRNVRGSLGGTHYFPIGREWVISLGSEVGGMMGINQRARISDRWFLGGEDFRGFEFGGLGPRDPGSGDALGGRIFHKSTVELLFPLGLPEEFDVRGRLFADVGALWNSGARGRIRGDNHSLRVSVGPGFAWNSPFGPVSLDLGWAIVKERFDKTEFLNFSIGAQF